MSYWYLPEKWRDEDVPEEYWDEFIKGEAYGDKEKDFETGAEGSSDDARPQA